MDATHQKSDLAQQVLISPGFQVGHSGLPVALGAKQELHISHCALL